jgi:hypothetical protein
MLNTEVRAMPTRGVTAINSRLVLDLHARSISPANRRSAKEGAGAAVEPSVFRTLRFQRAPVVFSNCRLNQES